AFQYTRVLADLRSVLRLSPATTLAVRAVAGHAVEGRLPAQRVFPAGGVDGLRAHRLGEYRGNQLALAQTEYTVGLWKLRSQFFEGGLHAIAFVDAGRAWQNDEHHWDLDRQRVQTDGGLGLGTSADNLRIYFATNRRRPGSDFVVSVRLRRPFYSAPGPVLPARLRPLPAAALAAGLLASPAAALDVAIDRPHENGGY